MKLFNACRRVGLPVEDVVLVIGVAFAGVVCQALLLQKNVQFGGVSPYFTNATLYLSSLVVIVSAEVLWLLWLERPVSPVAHVTAHLKRREHVRRLIRSAPILAALIVFMPLFSHMKSSIPLFRPYDWDTTFIEMDRLIHGQDAWRLLQPMFGYPIITSVLSILYHAWILLIYIGSIYFAIYVVDANLRIRYFISFFGIWIVCGIILATLLASVGPCFVGPILGMSTFDPQMDYLRQADAAFPVMTLDVQRELLAWYQIGSYGLGRGITAMPSMHVALAFLFFLAVRNASRKLGFLFGAFFLIILVGSVHLGYHYAVDGYVAIAVTYCIWRLSELVVGRLRPSESATEPQLAQLTNRQ